MKKKDQIAQLETQVAELQEKVRYLETQVACLRAGQVHILPFNPLPWPPRPYITYEPSITWGPGTATQIPNPDVYVVS